jgi:hypothetical protein
MHVGEHKLRYAITGIRNGMVAIANVSVVSLLSCLVSTVSAESKAVAKASAALLSAMLASAMASAALPSFGRSEPCGWGPGPGVGQRPFRGLPILVFGKPRHVTIGCLQLRQRPCYYVSADGGYATVLMYKLGEVLLSLVDLRNVFNWVKVRVSSIFHRTKR